MRVYYRQVSGTRCIPSLAQHAPEVSFSSANFVSIVWPLPGGAWLPSLPTHSKWQVA